MPDWPSVAPIQTWSKIPGTPYSVYNVHVAGVTTPYCMVLAQYTVGSPIVVGANGTTTVTACTYSWETTAKMPSAINNAGASVYKTANLEAISPYGPGGRIPAWANLAGLLLPSSSFSTLVMEFYGKWNAASAARADDRFWGLCMATGVIANASRGLGFYRKTTGWSVISSDGTTVSEAVEAADTSDANVHLFRIEWNDTNIKLYVDGTLKVTKTTNRPAIDASLVSQGVGTVGCFTNSGDGSPTWTICGFIYYWI